MSHRRRAIAGAAALAVLCSIGVAAQKKDDKKQDEAQKKELQTLVKIADDAAAGQSAPNDLGLAWMRDDYLKALGNKQYVPFIVTIDPSKVSSSTIALYWRVAAKNAAPPAPPAAAGAKDKDKKDDKDKKP